MSELIYQGGYRAEWPALPQRDLNATEVEAYGGQEFLLSTGLYREMQAEEPVHTAVDPHADYIADIEKPQED